MWPVYSLFCDKLSSLKAITPIRGARGGIAPFTESYSVWIWFMIYWIIYWIIFSKCKKPKEYINKSWGNKYTPLLPISFNWLRSWFNEEWQLWSLPVGAVMCQKACSSPKSWSWAEDNLVCHPDIFTGPIWTPLWNCLKGWCWFREPTLGSCLCHHQV